MCTSKIGTYERMELKIEGKVTGKNQGRKKPWLRNIQETNGIASAAELFKIAKERNKLAQLTANFQ